MFIKRRRNHIRILAIVLISVVSAMLFQNCSGGIQSQAANSDSSNNSSSSTPPPPTGPVSCTGAAPATVDTNVAACPTGQVGAGTISRVTYSCVGTTYVANSPILITDCAAAGTPAITLAETLSLCKPFIDTAALATVTSTAATMSLSSGLGDGAGGLGNGDVAAANLTATIQPNILPGTGGTYGQNISSSIAGAARTPSTISCAFDTAVSCDVVLAESSVSKAINMDPASANFGKDEVAIANAMTDSAARQVAIDRIKRNIFSTATSNGGTANTCAFNFADPLNQKSRNYRVENVRSLTTPTGYRCVSGTVKVRMSARTRVQGDNASRTRAPSATSDYSYVTVSIADGCMGESKLVSPNQDMMPANSNYGEAVASNSRWLAVLSGSDNNGATTLVGSITLFDKTNNNAAYKIYLPGATGGGSTGDATVAVALSGDMFAASRINRSTGKGAVYVYAFLSNAWSVVTSTPLAGAGNDKQRFGQALAFSGSTLAVGAPRFPTLTSGNDPTGKVYLYNCTTSGCSARGEIPHTANKGAQFGYSLSISGNLIAIGAPYLQAISDTLGEGFVSVYNIASTPSLVNNFSVASFSSGVLDTAITNPTPSGATPTGRHFGASVSLNGNKLIVGAPFLARDLGGGTVGAKAGGAYYYEDVNTSGSAVVLAGPGTDALFGSGVALNSSGAYVGCPLCQANMGVVQYFRYSGNSIPTTPTRRVFPLDRINRDGFGNSIFATDSDLIVGSSNRAYGSTGFVGAAYNYVVIP